MRILTLAFVCCCLLGLMARADDSLTASFQGLTSFEPDGALIYHQAEGAKPLVDPNESIPTEAPHPVLVTALDNTSPCRISFSWGPSEDPVFRIDLQDAQGNWQFAGEIGALALVVPGNGFLYAAGSANEMFDKRRKYRIREGQLMEVNQPFYRVDLETKTTASLELRSEPGGGDVVARLSPGSFIHVLVNRGDTYLVATPFGLTGWVTIPETQLGSPIEGLFFHGD